MLESSYIATARPTIGFKIPATRGPWELLRFKQSVSVLANVQVSFSRSTAASDPISTVAASKISSVIYKSPGVVYVQFGLVP